MKKSILILVLAVSARAHSQVDWKNYSTSFNADENAVLGVAIPYNGIYDNSTGKIVGIAHWNPQYKIDIDAALNDSIPLHFVYDTAGIYFLAPQVNKENTDQFEYNILLNNKTVITPWTHIRQFTQTEIGDMRLGSGMMGSYSANWGDYLVAQLRNRKGTIIASWVVYWKQNLPEISFLYTSNNPLEFSGIVNKKGPFDGGPGEIGWHRQYNNILGGQKKGLRLPYNENSILLNIDAEIYKKEALEYNLVSGGRIIRNWAPNEYNNNYILLKNLDPGDYILRIRFKRQRKSITELHFSISSIWYKTAAFRAAILAFTGLLTGFVIFYVKYRNQQRALSIINKKAEQNAGALKNVHALLNPHFTFNALSSIQALINQGNIDAANKYLSSFGYLLRETLNNSTIDLIPLDRELENLNTYLKLEQLRYRFIYDLSVADDIDRYTTALPPFLLQPFVENAIKHSLSGMDGRGALHVRVVKKGKTMLITITDNGRGFDIASVKEGHGLFLSKKRIALLNNEYKEDLIKLQIKSTKEGTGINIVFENWV